MLGHNAGRINALEAENNTLRADLLAQTERANALRTINATLRAERDALAMKIGAMAAATRNATQQAQAGRGYVIGESALDRLCRN